MESYFENRAMKLRMFLAKSDTLYVTHLVEEFELEGNVFEKGCVINVQTDGQITDWFKERVTNGDNFSIKNPHLYLSLEGTGPLIRLKGDCSDLMDGSGKSFGEKKCYFVKELSTVNFGSRKEKFDIFGYISGVFIAVDNLCYRYELCDFEDPSCIIRLHVYVRRNAESIKTMVAIRPGCICLAANCMKGTDYYVSNTSSDDATISVFSCSKPSRPERVETNLSCIVPKRGFLIGNSIFRLLYHVSYIRKNNHDFCVYDDKFRKISKKMPRLGVNMILKDAPNIPRRVFISRLKFNRAVLQCRFLSASSSNKNNAVFVCDSTVSHSVGFPLSNTPIAFADMVKSLKMMPCTVLQVKIASWMMPDFVERVKHGDIIFFTSIEPVSALGSVHFRMSAGCKILIKNNDPQGMLIKAGLLPTMRTEQDILRAFVDMGRLPPTLAYSSTSTSPVTMQTVSQPKETVAPHILELDSIEGPLAIPLNLDVEEIGKPTKKTHTIFSGRELPIMSIIIAKYFKEGHYPMGVFGEALSQVGVAPRFQPSFAQKYATVTQFMRLNEDGESMVIRGRIRSFPQRVQWSYCECFRCKRMFSDVQRKDAICPMCHMHNNMGLNTTPDMSSDSAHPMSPFTSPEIGVHSLSSVFGISPKVSKIQATSLSSSTSSQESIVGFPPNQRTFLNNQRSPSYLYTCPFVFQDMFGKNVFCYLNENSLIRFFGLEVFSLDDLSEHDKEMIDGKISLIVRNLDDWCYDMLMIKDKNICMVYATALNDDIMK
ncbi:hypothetical protein PCE1_002582 [Barthelona sp. PCE]